jgi:hypothetical protein
MKTQLLTIKSIYYSIIFIITLFSCNGCSEESINKGSEDELEQIEVEDINAYITSLSYNADELLGVEDTGSLPSKKTEGITETNNPDIYGTNTTTVCTTTEFNLKTNFESIAILKPNEGVIWPGALVKGDQSLKNGIPTPFTLSRSPMTIRVGLPGIQEAGTVLVETPNWSSVDAGIGKALEWWNANAYQEGYVNPASQYSEAKTSFSSKQASIELGLNASWASNDVASQFNYETTSTKRVSMMSFKQVFYTVTMDYPDNPSDVFADNITLAQVENAITSSVPPAYVHSVSYGRIIMFRMESNYEVSEVDFQGSFEYAAGKRSASGDVETKYKEILENSNITTIVIGGNAEVGASAVSAKNFGDLETIIKGKNAVYSRDNPGVPISYTVRYLKDNTLAKLGESTDYKVINCETTGKVHNEITFNNRLADDFRIGIEYKTNMPGENNVTYDDIAWKHNTNDGATTSIYPPNGAYDIYYHVERNKFGSNSGYETKLKDNIGDHVHDHEDCWESYRNWGSAEVRACE